MTGGAGHVVVAGAGLAGLRCAQALRAAGHTGGLTLLGDEPHLPYDRPPLSKEFLTGARTPAELTLPGASELAGVVRTGTAAASLDRDNQVVTLADGSTQAYDSLIIATGAGARDWPAPTPSGVLRLRGLDDAIALRTALARPGARLVVVGAGFLGGEIAAAAARLGVPTTLVEAQHQPLARVLGADAGAFLAGVHR